MVRSSQPPLLRLWSQNREIRFKRKSGSVRAVMRKRETIEPRYGWIKQKLILSKE